MTRMVEILDKSSPRTLAGGVSKAHWFSGARFDMDADRPRQPEVRRLRCDQGYRYCRTSSIDYRDQAFRAAGKVCQGGIVLSVDVNQTKYTRRQIK